MVEFIALLAIIVFTVVLVGFIAYRFNDAKGMK